MMVAISASAKKNPVEANSPEGPPVLIPSTKRPLVVKFKDMSGVCICPKDINVKHAIKAHANNKNRV